ncbi:hexosaminidase D-like [Rhinatrema bivittatum]|uniref:hexosaminidase D-like n=1 Tax=Rhinatrema bivittatum TaxID=194408 RepID=UPI00112CDA59|nr:hexosaminidase D-like [Rhinatrema bivittatum]XP_029432114.1 hexosaminidase D-like [Rhinatrema bivittatum]XP_029432115.1 hexosaminidase D-like [Rhinatrema bivittatum]XP_029432116.1 hexosaminidase D-like [Rhinatrema bivittatum]
MSFLRKHKLTVLRLLVLFILMLAVIKYMLRDSSQRQRRVQELMNNKVNEFWGKGGEKHENLEIRQLPAQPPRESESQKKAADIERAQAKDFSTTQMRLVHLDLKGAAPKLSYMKQIFPLLAKLGANGLLIEYEDMFPYREELEVLRSPYAYSEEDIETIQHLAEINRLEVVPLVQTFGHMEFVLKHDKFRHLREVEKYPNSLNPHSPETLPLVKALLAQVMDKHKKSAWLHIGADEVYHLGEGQDSKNWINSNKGDLGKMYLNHLKEVVSFIRNQYPGLQTLIWDDMLRKLEVETIRESGITESTSPVLWIYAPDFSMKDTENFISKYEQSGFKTIWFASAFKGATGPVQMWTPMSYHLKNHQYWLHVIESMPRFPGIRFQGIAITGWQRYDHYSALCELLPVGIPSLAICLQSLVNGAYDDTARQSILQTLGFQNIDIEKNSCEGNGAFAGFVIYRTVEQIHKQLKSKVLELLQDERVISGWFTPYHRKHRFANPRNLEMFGSKVLKTHEEWERLIQDLRTEMNAMYFADTVEEWMEENVNPHMDQLRELVKDYQEILKLNARPKAIPQK